MKLRTFSFAIASICLINFGFAADTVNPPQYRNSGWYINGATGVSFATQFNMNVAYINAQGDIQSTSGKDTSLTAGGYNLLTAIGYRWDKWWRTDISFGYIHNDVKTTDIGSASYSSSGDLTTTALFLNGYFDIPLKSKLTPYIGLGLGTLNMSLNSNSIAPSDGDIDQVNQTASFHPLAYQIIVGGNYFLKPTLDIFLEYHHIHSQNLNSTINNTLTSPASIYSYSYLGSASYQANLVNLGVRWYFA